MRHGKRCDCYECYAYRKFHRISESDWWNELSDEEQELARACLVAEFHRDGLVRGDDELRELCMLEIKRNPKV